MKCPFCAQRESRVIDTREVGDGIRRRRECQSCQRRFTTYEHIAPINLLVIKRDGRREEFNRDKLYEGLRRACTKRPISTQVLMQIADEIESQLYSSGESEVESRVIGEMVMDRLKGLDEVAYVRFASVYRRFEDVDVLIEEAEELKRWKEQGAGKKAGTENT